MLKVKLVRFGKKHSPSFRIIVNEARTKDKGKYVECLGFYNPPHEFKLNKAKYQSWLAKGAWPTASVKKLIADHEGLN